MATKKQKPAVAKRVADRKAFVKDKVASKGITAKQARQRFYVQTRMAELKAAGKTVTPEMRKQLQQKFQSGNVSRQGFAAPKKKTGTTKKVVPLKSAVRTPSSSYMDPKKRPAAKIPNSSYMNPKKTGKSAANISSTRTGVNANHSQRSATQVIRNQDALSPRRTNPSTRYAPTYSIGQYVRRAEAYTPGKKAVAKKK